MIGAHISNIYLVSAIFTIFFILLKRIAYISYVENAEGFKFAKEWYYWAEMAYVLFWANLTPQHTYEEALTAIVFCLGIKLAAKQFTIVDRLLMKWFKK